MRGQVGEKLLCSVLASSLYGLGSIVDRSFTTEISCYGPGLWHQGFGLTSGQRKIFIGVRSL